MPGILVINNMPLKLSLNEGGKGTKWPWSNR